MQLLYWAQFTSESNEELKTHAINHSIISQHANELSKHSKGSASPTTTKTNL